MRKNTLTLFLLMLVASIGFSQSTATYDVTFTSTWSQATHPHSSGSLPSSAHWSRLVGATHNSEVSFVQEGQVASQGIEDIAERGSNVQFFNEVTTAINNGAANEAINGNALGSAEGQISIEGIETTEEFPLLTLSSMIAPSPDWMITAPNVNLLDTNGDWKQSITLDVYPYDAGTDSGTDYTSPDADTTPKANIANARGTMPFSSEKIGTMTIELQNVILGTNDITAQVSISIFPNPFTDRITLEAKNVSLIGIEIYNVLGKKVREIKQNIGDETTIDVSSLTSGVYLLKATDSKNNVTTKKIIKR